METFIVGIPQGPVLGLVSYYQYCDYCLAVCYVMTTTFNANTEGGKEL